MKKNLLLSLAAIVLVPMAAMAADGDTFVVQTAEGIDMTFKVLSESDKTCCVGAGDVATNTRTNAIDAATEGKVTIPATANGYTVTEVAFFAFQSCSKVTEIVVPEGITTIGDRAFGFCSELATLTLPGTVKGKLGDYAFAFDSKLTSLTIPEGVTEIGAYAFMDCTGITEITIPNSVKTMGNRVFADCTALETVNFGTGLETMGTYVFTKCSKLKEAILPESLTAVNNYCFNQCTGLTKVVVPGSVKSIGNRAFYQNKALTTLELNEGLESIGQYAFYQTTALKSVTLPGTLRTFEEEGYCFYGSGLTGIVIPEGVTAIPTYCFAQCTAMTEASIPATCNSIGGSAFSGNDALVKVTTFNPEPYEIPTYTVFPLMSIMNTDLYVPYGTAEAYKATSGWTGFRNYIEMERTAVNDIRIDGNQTSQRYNLQGQPVDENYKGIVIMNGKKMIQK